MTVKQKVDLFCMQAPYKAKDVIMNTKDRISNSAKRIVKDEEGDTNFISIAIILVVVLVIAGVFIAFGQQILDWFSGTVTNFWGGKNHTSGTKPSSGVSGSILQ